MPITLTATYTAHSTYSPHHPHHRPVPFTHTIFPPDPAHHSNTAQSNPTHGQKVSTDPSGRRSPKYEHSGPVAKDSLAADSLRAGGSFSAGGPTGISGSSGLGGTFAVDPREGGGNVRTLHAGKEGLEGGLGHADRQVREKTKECGDFSGSGSMGAYNVSAGEFESLNTEGGRIGASSGGGGLGASKYSGGDSTAGEGRGSRQTAGSTTTTTSGGHGNPSKKVPHTARNEETLEPGLDWSKVPKDTKITTDIDSNEDPGRAGAIHMLAQKAKRDYAMGTTRGKGGDNENRFDLLNDSEGAPGTEKPSRTLSL
ncbi:uncharacterized protein H6S33_009208 [Morchella sextelata]|uniref:uncharacterized protein n=1 Tax=Morchella sextelata TaxID=1174677 RepID=UPI001D04B24D|nr:uncharacterized protein H6S33_009208 [Morchella sextelata]KAH0612828.1 hypothetical protein H6S33_009208 [Morchella sextelata]